LSSARHYRVHCQGCGRAFEDDGVTLECPDEHDPALLATRYEEKQFVIDPDGEGIFRYAKWLPGIRTLRGAGSNITYKSEALNRIVGLPNVWVVFNGYWPERGASLATTTFKDLEAWSVLARLPDNHEGVLVIASAGNTAAAFARACSINKVPVLIVIPEAGLQSLQFSDFLDPCVKIISLVGFTDYLDAIMLANRISEVKGFFPEGGVKNIARIEGLGTTLLNATETIGRIPHYYLQAIGSGAGGIGVHLAAQKLAGDGRFGENIPRLMLSQNLPFVPIYLSWKSHRRQLVEIPVDDGKKQIQQIAAHVLSNRKPPYGVRGGVFDILTETGGDMLVADNLETLHAERLFEETEGIDIDPASAVAFATLLKAARYGGIQKEALVLLNITGGGRYRQRLDQKLIPARPTLQLDEKEILLEWTVDRIVGLFH
jgi:cysteate synthase